MLEIIILILSAAYPSCCQNCASPDGKMTCCTGYKWDNNTSECVECPIGYEGLNCETLCLYPSYGRFCQEECSCNNASKCDPITGCTDTDNRNKQGEQGVSHTKVILPIISVCVIIALLCTGFALRKFCIQTKTSKSSEDAQDTNWNLITKEVVSHAKTSMQSFSVYELVGSNMYD